MNNASTLAVVAGMAAGAGEDINKLLPPTPLRTETPWYRIHLPKSIRKGKTQAELDILRKAKWEATNA